eukprot:TRINITY_DN2316_c0_g1_i2.p1 TRINITY_DN2316_c0_g1~~TRINITY_DN2316_c0_g1_i2.p1  ORF type:complete len:483 (-),score=109.63 TRINITY_DN2316_c0_g1_i2:63-1511(-)
MDNNDQLIEGQEGTLTTMEPRYSNKLYKVNEYLYLWEGNTPIDPNCIKEKNIEYILFTFNPTISINDIEDKCIIMDLKNKWEDDISKVHLLMKNIIGRKKRILVVYKQREYDSYILIFLHFNILSKVNYESSKEELINKFKIQSEIILEKLKKLENWLDIHDPFSQDFEFLYMNNEDCYIDDKFNEINVNIDHPLNPVKYNIDDNSHISNMEYFDTNNDMIISTSSISDPSSLVISSFPLTTLPLPIPIIKKEIPNIHKENVENQSMNKKSYILEKPSKLKRPLPCEFPTTKQLKNTVKKVKTTKSKPKKQSTKQTEKKRRVKLSDLFPSQLLKPNMDVSFRKKVGVLTETGQISYKNTNFKSPSEFTDFILKELNYSTKTRANPWVEIEVGNESLHVLREKYFELENNPTNENIGDNDDDDVEYKKPTRNTNKKHEIKKVAVKKNILPTKNKTVQSDSDSREINSDETEFVPGQNSPNIKK